MRVIIVRPLNTLTLTDNCSKRVTSFFIAFSYVFVPVRPINVHTYTLFSMSVLFHMLIYLIYMFKFNLVLNLCGFSHCSVLFVLKQLPQIKKGGEE